MKQSVIMLSAILFFVGACANAQDFIVPIIPVGCPIQQTASQPCTTPCPQKCESAPVFNSCEEIQQWKTKYFEKRCKVYTQLGLTQEQRVKAKIIDERYFDEIAPLKVCCKNERAKYAEMKCKNCKWSERREQKGKINDLKSEIKDKKKEHAKCFEEILTSCQKSSYKKIKKADLKCKC